MKTAIRIIKWMSIALMLGGSLPVQAQLTVSVNPAARSVALNQDHQLTLNWLLSSARGDNLRSSQAVLMDAASGRALQVYPNLLVSNGTGAISENLRLDRTTLSRAADSGINRLLYQRRWQSDSGEQGQASLQLSLVGSLGGGFSIRDIQLRFSSGETRSKLLQRDATEHVQARLNYQGRSGLIDYQWQISQPDSSHGENRFITFGQGRENVNLGSPHTIRSPRLPSLQPGEYELRFVLNQPGRQVVSIRYRVASQAAMELLLQRPQTNARITPNALFSWTALADATAYQFEIWRNQQRVGGILVPAENTPQVALSSLLREQLADGGNCHWRVLAYDEYGQLLTASEVRPVRLLPDRTRE